MALALVAAVAFLPRLIRRLKSPGFVDAATLKRRLDAGEKVALIDVRDANEFTGPLALSARAIRPECGPQPGGRWIARAHAEAAAARPGDLGGAEIRVARVSEK